MNQTDIIAAGCGLAGALILVYSPTRPARIAREMITVARLGSGPDEKVRAAAARAGEDLDAQYLKAEKVSGWLNFLGFALIAIGLHLALRSA